MFVCNGVSPCPTLTAQEGDLVEMTVHSDSYFQSSIHWYVLTCTVFANSIFTITLSSFIVWHLSGSGYVLMALMVTQVWS
jgi:hypothetical protein